MPPLVPLTGHVAELEPQPVPLWGMGQQYLIRSCSCLLSGYHAAQAGDMALIRSVACAHRSKL